MPPPTPKSTANNHGTASSGAGRPSLSAVSSGDLLGVVCNNTTSALFIMDEHQQCVYMNPAAEALTGYTLADVRGRSLHDVIHHTHPDGRPYPLSECPIDQAFPRNNQEQGQETFVHRDGHFYPVEFTASPVRDASGTPIGTVIEVRDITERLREEQKLLASQEYLRSAIDSAASAFYAVDRDGATTVCNNTFLRLLRFRRAEDVVGRKLHELIHHTRPDGTHYPDEQCPIYRAATEGIPAHIDHEHFYRVDGTSFPVEYWAQPTFINGELRGAVTTFIDLTSRRAAEQALEDVRARLDAALTAGEIGTFVWDIVHDRLYGDRNFAVLFSVELDADGAAPLRAFVDAIHPDDRQEVLRLVRQTLETGCDYTAEYRIITGGRERWVIARGRAEYDANRTPLRFPGVLLDITERKVAERARAEISERLEQQRRLFEGIASTTPDFIYILDHDGRFLYANRRLLEVWGRTFDDAVGKTVYELGYPQWHADMHMREIAQVIETKRPVSGEVPFTGGSGIFGVYEYIFAPVLGPDGEVEVIAGTTRDVTARKEAQDALRAHAQEREALLDAERAARAQAESASRLKDDFLATLSHELRTPLNAILGWTQLLRRGPHDPAYVSEGLSVIERNTRVQVQLIEDLLDMSRIVSGKLGLDVQRVDLADVIRASIDSMTPAAEAKDIRLEPVLSTGIGHVRGDPARLQQVFWNLLSNAIKFTPRGGTVQVTLARVNSHCEVTVTDTGEGISPEFLPHVFERFRQADGGISRSHQGLGLGLAIVKNVVEMHGGTVHARSPGPHQGSTFSVHLPLMVVHHDPPQEVDRASSDAPLDTQIAKGEAAPLLDGVDVLVVDDDRDARELIRRVLENARASVRVAASAAEALEMLKGARPHVLVSDIGMPGEDGYSLIRRVRALPAQEGGDIPALALTAFARSEDRRRALVAGFHAHVAKPVEPPELVTVVASLAGRLAGRSGGTH